MGLRYVHISFISLASLCLIGFGGWALFTPREMMAGLGRLGGLGSVVLGTALVAYIIWFCRKSARLFL